MYLTSKYLFMLKILLAVPKTIWFNFRYLPFIQAIHLPIWIAPNCKIKVKKIKCTTYKFAAIRIGFHEVPIMDPKSKTVVNGYGSIIFKGTAHIINQYPLDETSNFHGIAL